MASIAVQSVGTGAWQGPTNPVTTTIAKPTGLAVGDMMFLTLSYSGATGPTTTGWTSIRAQTNSGANFRVHLFYKVADSADVAASNFPFTIAASASIGGAIMRIDGFYATTPIQTSAGDEVDASSTPSYANADVGPVYPSSLYVFATSHLGDSDATNHAIVTSNPTWTSRFNVRTTALAVSAATAVRLQSTNTGAASCTLGSAVDSVGILVVVNSILDVAPAPAVLVGSTSVPSPTIQVGVVLTPSVVTVNVTVQAPTVQIKNTWANPDKNNSSWSNQDKSAL